MPTTTFPTWAHQYQPVKRITLTETMRVEAGLHHITGNARPHFTVTATVTDSTRRSRDKFDRGGCLHEEIAKHFPALVPVIALHLSDDRGQPMHAKANGWYWLAGYWGDTNERYTGANSTPERSPDDCLRIFADHVRLPLTEARSLAFRLRVNNVELTARRQAWGEWCDTQAERWASEAESAIRLLDSLAGVSHV